MNVIDVILFILARHLAICVIKHKGISFHYGLQLISPPISAIRENIHNNLNDHQNYNICNELKI